MPRPVLRHGSRSCYVAGCHRPECVAANRAYKAEWTARRLAAGWKLSQGRWTAPSSPPGSDAR